MEHPLVRMEGPMQRQGLIGGGSKVWCVTSGGLVEVYSDRGADVPILRMDAADMQVKNGRVVMGRMKFTAGDAVQLEKWEECWRFGANQRAERYYEMGERIGKGSFSEVFRASKRDGHGEFALKRIEVPGKQGKQGKLALKFFQREVRILSRFQSDYVVHALDIFSDSKKFIILMDYMDIGSVYRYVRKQKRLLSELEVAWIIFHVLLGLQDLHTAGIIHRDISAKNILLHRNEGANSHPVVRIADLGLAFDRSEGDPNHEKHAVGFLPNIAPEVYRGKPWGEQVDLWAAGIVCYELLTGNHPFPQYLSKGDLAFNIGVVGTVGFPRSQWASISPEGKHLTQQLLVAEPNERMALREALMHPFFGQVKRILS